MKNWKLIAIIGATAVATAAAVVVLLQKQQNKRKMRFDSAEFDDDCLDDIACGEQCTCCGQDLDITLPEEAVEAAEELGAEAGAVVVDIADAVENTVEDAVDAVEEMAEDAKDAVEDAVEKIEEA